MIRRRSALAAAILSSLAPHLALAHGSLEGAGNFYTGLLHPFVVPAELLPLLALALLMGRSGLAACRRTIPALAIGVAAGLAIAQAHGAISDATALLTVLALIAAAIVTTGLRAPIWVGVGLALPIGLAVGFDAAPEPGVWSAVLLTASATLLGCTALAAILASLTLKAEKPWSRIAVQIAGSWILASALLYLSYQMTAPVV